MRASGLEAALGAKAGKICAVGGELTGATPRDRLEGLGSEGRRGRGSQGARSWATSLGPPRTPSSGRAVCPYTRSRALPLAQGQARGSRERRGRLRPCTALSHPRLEPLQQSHSRSLPTLPPLSKQFDFYSNNF